MYRLNYLPVAKQDIEENLLYIADKLKAPKAARDLLTALEKAGLLLQKFPYSNKIYRTIRPLCEEYRLLRVNNYAVLYIVREQDKVVEIRRVVYAKMDLSKLN